MKIQSSKVLSFFDNVSNSEIQSALFIENSEYIVDPISKKKNNRNKDKKPTKSNKKPDVTNQCDSKSTKKITPSAPEVIDVLPNENTHSKTNGFIDEEIKDMDMKEDISVINGKSDENLKKLGINNLSWQNKSRLYFMNKKQVILIIT